MGQLIVRGLDDRLIQTLKQRAGRSAEAEHRAILEQALAPELEPFAEAAARLRATMQPVSPTSAELIRADRAGNGIKRYVLFGKHYGEQRRRRPTHLMRLNWPEIHPTYGHREHGQSSFCLRRPIA